MAEVLSPMYLGGNFIGQAYIGEDRVVYNPYNIADNPYKFRTDPYAAYLELAIPGTQFSTLGMSNYYSDVSAGVKGSGSNKSIIPSGSGANILFASSSVNTNTYDFSTDGYTTSIYQGNAQNVGALPASALSFGTSNFVIELYVRFTSALTAPPFNNFIFGFNSGDQILIDHNSGTSRFYVNGSDGANVADTYTQNAWTHFAFVRSGSTFNQYKNGSRIKTYSGTSGAINTPSYWSLLGFDIGNTNDGGQKQINDFKIYIGTDKGYTGDTIQEPESIVTYA
jgi:hypothetical protein